MEFLPTEIEQYALQFAGDSSQLLKNLARETRAEVLQPRMLSGEQQGRFLSFISKIRQPQYILEIGTYTGYAALCLAEGLKKDGELHTIDINEELETRIKKYFQKSDFSHQLHFHLGNALDVVQQLNKPWDLVFIDADKPNYLNYYNLIIDQLNPGAVILADNVLWSGKVCDENALLHDEETKSLHQFNEFLKNDKRVDTFLLPLRDGIMMARKRQKRHSDDKK